MVTAIRAMAGEGSSIYLLFPFSDSARGIVVQVMTRSAFTAETFDSRSADLPPACDVRGVSRDLILPTYL